MSKKHKTISHKKTDKPNRMKELAVIVIVLAIAISLAFIFYSSARPKSDAVAKVNGVEITNSDLEEIALTVPPQLRDNVTEEDILEQAINFELIRQEAEKTGITITDAEVESNIDSSLASAGLTRDDLKESIKQQGIEWDVLFNAYKKQLLSFKFLNETIMKNVNVTEEEQKEFYDLYSDRIGEDFDSVKEDIKQTLLVTKSQQLLGEWLQQKRAESTIQRIS